MAIARVVEAFAWPAQQYDQLTERIALAGHAALGVLFARATATLEGQYAVDVYESKEVAAWRGEWD